ncbi:FHA domain-containing protein [Anaerolineales bacterium HSG6]|nr:FHA domain-containing protein [Anaerolineales bacterium HSG6]
MEHLQTEQALLIWKEGDLIKEQWILQDTGHDLVIGRSNQCDIMVPVRWVSRQHARLCYRKGQFALEDGGSKNGVFVNGKRVIKPRPLEDGDVIQLAPSLELIYVDNEATAPLPGGQAGIGIRIDLDERQVYVHGQRVTPPLSKQQYQLLSLFSEHPGKVYSRNEVVEAVWPNEWAEGVTDDAIDALIRRLRQRLAKIDPDYNFIITVRGYGFKLDDGRSG